MWQTKAIKADNGDIFLPIPADCLAALGWSENDEIKVAAAEDGSLVFHRVLNEVEPKSVGQNEWPWVAAALFSTGMAFLSERLPGYTALFICGAFASIVVAAYFSKRPA